MRNLKYLGYIWLLISCRQSQQTAIKIIDCEEHITEFLYPAHLEELENDKYICDSIVPFSGNKNADFYQQFKVLFSDRNYMLVNYNSRTRLLHDKKEGVWFVFKPVEANNFYFNRKEYKNIYGLSQIFITDDNFLPLFSLGTERITAFQNDEKNKYFKEYQVKLNSELPHNINVINYKELLHLAKELKVGNYKKEKEVYNSLLEYFYDDPPLWTEL